MHSRRARWGATWAMLCAAACSSDDPSRSGPTSGAQANAGRGVSNENADNPRSASMPGATGSGGSGQSGGDGPTGLAGSGDEMPDFSCAKTTEEAQRVPVEMYIMLDRSDSMNQPTGTGETKWEAIRMALGDFVSDPRSEGLMVGLQYFPIGRPGVPTQCTEDSECGVGAPCMTRMCQPEASVSSFQPIFCASDSECPPDTLGCVDFGVCTGQPQAVCFNLGRFGCGIDGDCARVISSCKGYSSCEPAVYAAPAVEIGVLPDQAQAITNSLFSEMPIGLTPTAAALSGALQQARERALAEPTHRVIAVLATDGLPTECPPTDAAGVADIARVAFASDEQLQTYVIGVFGPEEPDAQTNLDTWARAGGTPAAFILDPTQDVNAQFLDALEEIRGGTLACEYMLPPSPAGNEIDLGLVNVEVVADPMTRQLRYVGDSASCDRTDYGWHYDAPPDSGKATKIVACDATCELLKTTSGRVDIKLGCKTVGPD
jgi:hypothetical protein